ncbi:MAG: PorP/SprF family type IX secretion system membrane protein [Bacteroidales bacterium]|nr:PorP/SprF family type IX secretion system membrane protein [Bacteroidales bacterium]
MILYHFVCDDKRKTVNFIAIGKATKIRFFSAINLSLTFLIISHIFLLAESIQAQDVSFSQMYSNRLYLNPAFAGVEQDVRRISLNYRNQWPGIGNSFVSYSASYDQYMEPLHGGVGFRVFNDKQGDGAMQEFSLSMDYSYHLKISRKLSLNAGFEASFVQKSLETSGFILGDMIDPLTGNPDIQSLEAYHNDKVSYPDFAVGLSGFYENYYGGISISHILKPSQTSSSNIYSRIPRKVIAYAGSMIPIYEKKLGKEVLQLSPNIIYQQQMNFSQIYYGLEAVIKDQLITGIWIRQNFGVRFSSLIFSLGYITNSYRMRYSYDQKLSSPTIQLPNLGAHEISFILTLESVKKIRHQAIKCPKI